VPYTWLLHQHQQAAAMAHAQQYAAMAAARRRAQLSSGTAAPRGGPWPHGALVHAQHYAATAAVAGQQYMYMQMQAMAGAYYQRKQGGPAAGWRPAVPRRKQA